MQGFLQEPLLFIMQRVEWFQLVNLIPCRIDSHKGDMPRSTKVCLSGARQKQACAVVEMLVVSSAIGLDSSSTIGLLISVLWSVRVHHRDTEVR